MRSLKYHNLIKINIKKQKAWIMCLLFFAFFSVSCKDANEQFYNFNGPKVYLLDEENLTLKGIPLNAETVVDTSAVQEVVNYALGLLRNGVKSSKFSPTIPESLALRYYYVDGTNLKVDFSQEYYDLSGADEIFLRSSLIRTVTSFEQFDTVEFFVRGVPLKLDDGTVVGRQYERDVLLTYNEVSSRTSQKPITVYLPNREKTKLIPTFITINTDPNKKIEELVVELIIQGDLVHVFQNDLKLINVYTHEGVCFVDFSKELLTSYLPLGISERLAIYTLVNSLTELSNITSVQILVDGEIASSFQGTLSLDRMFTKNYALIEY